MWKPELIWVLLDRTCSTPMAERTNHTRNIAPDYFRSIYSVFWFTLLKCIQQPWLIDKNIRNYCAARPTAVATKAFTHRKFIAHAQFYVVTAYNFYSVYKVEWTQSHTLFVSCSTPSHYLKMRKFATKQPKWPKIVFSMLKSTLPPVVAIVTKGSTKKTVFFRNNS